MLTFLRKAARWLLHAIDDCLWALNADDDDPFPHDPFLDPPHGNTR